MVMSGVKKRKGGYRWSQVGKRWLWVEPSREKVVMGGVK